MSASAARLRAVLAPLLAEAGIDLDDVTVTPAGRRSVVRVVVDTETGISLDEVAEASRTVSDALDALDQDEPDVLGSSYVLEVSSPGVDRPLTLPRHWRRNHGRLVKVVRRDGGEVTGRVTELDDAPEGGVVLEVDGRPQRIAYLDVARASVQVEFARHDRAAEAGEDEA